MEKRYLRKGGGVVWAEVSRAMVRDPGGAPLLIVGVARDITAQRQAEDEVRALNAGLEARVHQRTETGPGPEPPGPEPSRPGSLTPVPEPRSSRR
jgi:hypothetical protein